MNTALRHPLTEFSDHNHRKVAREIAMGIFDLPDILDRAGMDVAAFNALAETPYFKQMLVEEMQQWGSTLNTHERVKVKAAVVMEDWMETAAAILHDKTETLSGRAEIAKLLARIAGMGLNNTEVSAGGERLSITINLGADTLKIEKDVTPKVIEHTEDV